MLLVTSNQMNWDGQFIF